jgi:hypothetical protein
MQISLESLELLIMNTTLLKLHHLKLQVSHLYPLQLDKQLKSYGSEDLCQAYL